MMLGVDGVDRDQLQIGSLDVKDAFLMANQEQPVQIGTKSAEKPSWAAHGCKSMV